MCADYVIRRWNLSSKEIDAVKGFFICLIVLGHITVFSQHFMTAFNVMYNYHVAAFLFLSFLLGSSRPSRHFVADRVVRYLVPFYFFVAVTSVLYFIFVIDRSQTGILTWLADVGVAFIIGSDDLLDRACGIRVYWFLPTLFSLALLKYIYDNAQALQKTLLLATAVAVHLFIGTVSLKTRSMIPFGIHFAFFLLIPALAIRAVCSRVPVSNRYFQLATVLLWLVCTVAGLSWPSYNAIAGALNVYSVLKPMRLLFHDIYAAAAFLSVLSLSGYLGKTKILPIIGRHSLAIFLTHSLAWQLVIRSGLWQGIVNVEFLQGGLIESIIAFILTMSISLIISISIDKSKRFNRVLFPRTLKEWPPVVYLGKLA